MQKNNLKANKIAIASGVGSDTIKRVIERNTTRSKKLAAWCEDNGIILGGYDPREIKQYAVNPVAKVEIVSKYVVGERLPFCLDSIIAHIYKVKRDAQVAIPHSECERFEDRAAWLGIKVEEVEENSERRIYDFEVMVNA